MANSYRNKNKIIPQNLITATNNYRTPYQDSFSYTKKHAIRAARDLCYGDAVIAKLKAATTEGEIERIMRDARHSQY